jgi:hypothetical protein
VSDSKDWIEPRLEMEKRESKYCTWKERAIIWRREREGPSVGYGKKRDKRLDIERVGDKLKMRKKRCARR